MKKNIVRICAVVIVLVSVFTLHFLYRTWPGNYLRDSFDSFGSADRIEVSLLHGWSGQPAIGGCHFGNDEWPIFETTVLDGVMLEAATEGVDGSLVDHEFSTLCFYPEYLLTIYENNEPKRELLFSWTCSRVGVTVPFWSAESIGFDSSSAEAVRLLSVIETLLPRNENYIEELINESMSRRSSHYE